jgi:Mrp family chromosome partitioning ATPase
MGMEIHKTVQAFQRLKGQETILQTAGVDTSEGASRCHVIGFAGAKGRVGTTTVALNVAMTLIHGGHRVIFVELSPHSGTAAWLLLMPHQSPLRHASTTLTDMNEAVVSQLFMQHRVAGPLCVHLGSRSGGSSLHGILDRVIPGTQRTRRLSGT